MSTFKSTRMMALEDIEVSLKRPLRGRSASLPHGAVLVSSDSHWNITDDIFYERAPVALKDRMPRIWVEESGNLCIGIGHKNLLAGPVNNLLASFARPGFHDLSARMADLDDDGVAMEIIYPQWLMFYLHHPDLEMREWLFKIYNEYLADLEKESKGRFHGVGIPVYWDSSKAAASVEHIKSIGLKAAMLPVNPGNNPQGLKVNYATDDLDPMWSAAEGCDLPITYHIGENPNLEGPGGVGAGLLATFMPFRRSLGDLIFGGIFDRHPKLRVVFAEAGINWVAGALQDAEMIFDSWGDFLDPKIKHRPTEYWHRHCYATFMADEVGLDLIDYIGADRVMWATDYPHNEGSHGYTEKVVDSIVERVGPGAARKILGQTAMEIFALDMPTAG
ncbi:amidohydrolase family protein [Sphingosinicella microcystinivorans]|uniref:amidohydrolase family protein n=1 Tax=Sphingosinicella microcystinivorans TaxID=335406 RepID=UPI0022F3EE1B|nr:amidohydrolase family protein [Sphingosinicella microcystinivorans]WBX83778.1 amidohydrolase family protein [Sphingosinicella microcystinivorans]